MILSALQFSSDANTLSYTQLSFNSLAEIDEAKKTMAPVVFLINESNIASLMAFENAVRDCGSKKANKELAAYLLHKEKIPLIRCSYKRNGQLFRSVRAFLANVKAHHDHNIYLICVNDTLFEELKIKATIFPVNGESKRSDSGERLQILQLMPKVSVPESVKSHYLGSSREVLLVHQLILKAARQLDPVLILGETGTGKEVVARCIHDESMRKNGPFIPVNCGAISAELFESEIFGHVIGAFTGANANKKGLWQAAENGTLFFDEIGDLPLPQQVKILRVLDNQKIRQVGGHEEMPVNARIIAATNKDLHKMVADGGFREDLFYRLNVFVLRTPALRTHPEDIPDLAQTLWKKIIGDAKAVLSKEILREFQRFNWHGNVREMKMVLTTLYSYFGKTRLNLAQLHAVYFQQAAPDDSQSGSSASDRIHYRKDCLAHLLKVDLSLRQYKIEIRPLLEGTHRRKKIKLDVIANLVDNLDMLSSRRLYYGDLALFDDMRHLNGQLRAMIQLMNKNHRQALLFWNAEVRANYKKVEKKLFGVVKELDR